MQGPLLAITVACVCLYGGFLMGCAASSGEPRRPTVDAATIEADTPGKAGVNTPEQRAPQADPVYPILMIKDPGIAGRAPAHVVEIIDSLMALHANPTFADLERAINPEQYPSSRHSFFTTRFSVYGYDLQQGWDMTIKTRWRSTPEQSPWVTEVSFSVDGWHDQIEVRFMLPLD